GQTAPSAPLLPPVGIGEGGEPVDLMTSGGAGVQPLAALAQPVPAPLQTAAAAPAEQLAASGWVVQVGAAPTESGATTLLSDATGSISGLGEFRPHVEKFEKNGQTFYRARFTGFGNRDDAAAMCN